MDYVTRIPARPKPVMSMKPCIAGNRGNCAADEMAAILIKWSCVLNEPVIESLYL